MNVHGILFTVSIWMESSWRYIFPHCLFELIFTFFYLSRYYSFALIRCSGKYIIFVDDKKSYVQNVIRCTSSFSRFCIIRTSVTTPYRAVQCEMSTNCTKATASAHETWTPMRYSLVLAHMEIFHFVVVVVVVVVSCNSIRIRFIY